MSNRFDNRSVSTFKKDIYFGTQLEKYFFSEWLRVCEDNPDITIADWDNNGVDNDGGFIASGNTAGADYKVTGSFRPHKAAVVGFESFKDHPLEVKWVPTAGKFTLKEGDLKSYIKEGASILFIYNSVRCGTDLRKPKDYDLERHIKLVESKSQQIRWGIMWADKVKEFYDNAKENNLIEPIHYMGGKQGVVLKQEDFNNWFIVEEWSI
jgi:hypothetical protein|tara:strand:+ start:1951 stop:2577 length:627 start_codon:yes stop_codon:yes gene_type:complete